MAFWISAFVGGFCLYLAKCGIVKTWNVVQEQRKNRPIPLSKFCNFNAMPTSYPSDDEEIVEAESVPEPDVISHQGIEANFKESVCCSAALPVEERWKPIGIAGGPQSHTGYMSFLREKSADQKPPINKFYRLKPGYHGRIRLLPVPQKSLFGNPDIEDSASAFGVARQHYIDPGKGNVYQCLKRINEVGDWHGDCPICDYYEEKHDSSMGRYYSIPNEVKKLKAVERFYYNVAVKNGGTYSGPLIWSVGKSVHVQIVRLFQREGDLTDLDTGCDLLLENENSGPFNQIKVSTCGNSPFRAAMKILANQFDLDKLVDVWQTKSRQELEDVVESLKNPKKEDFGLGQCRQCLNAFYYKGGCNKAYCSRSCATLKANASALTYLEPPMGTFIDDDVSRSSLSSRWMMEREGKKCKGGDLHQGLFVFWETGKGTMSLKPSVVLETVGDGKNQQVRLMYKSGQRWKRFWVNSVKCTLATVKHDEYCDMWDEWRRYHQQEMMKGHRLP